MKFLNTLILIGVLILNAPETIATEAGPGSDLAVGRVVETIEAAGYVYLRLEEQDKWIATPIFAVSVGDQIQYTDGMEMRDFYSKALDRTFESVFFIQNASLVNEDTGASHAAAIEKGHAGIDMPMPGPTSVQLPAVGLITPLPEGKTIADIFAESTQLDGQVVSLNARVIKVSKNIMGKNWITLQDGTGTEQNNQLKATSKQAPSKGDILIVRGIVRANVDIGSGYKYKVLLEEVTFSPGYQQITELD